MKACTSGEGASLQSECRDEWRHFWWRRFSLPYFVQVTTCEMYTCSVYCTPSRTVHCALSTPIVQPCSVHLYSLYDAHKASAHRCAPFTALYTSVYCNSYCNALHCTAPQCTELCCKLLHTDCTVHCSAHHTAAHCIALHITAQDAAHVTIPRVIVRVGFLRITNRRWRSPYCLDLRIPWKFLQHN